MLTFSLQTYDMLSGGPLTLFIAVVLSIWVVWGAKAAAARRYSPYTNGYPEMTVAVVIPVVDEPEELFEKVLRRITSQGPEETIVVINGARNKTLEAVCERTGVRHLWTETPGKRNAVKEGVQATTGEIVVLVDSDTVWEDDTLQELLRPFAHAEVGGVTTQQRILEPERNLITRWADWSERIRWSTTMPAYSTLGTVGCLPGRTIAFRRRVLEDVMEEFMTERYMGTHLEVSDDRSLTNLCLKQGYSTVYQSSSVVHTDAPTSLRQFVRQQLRWARGSQYNTMRMLPWMLRNTPALAAGFLYDILLPFALLGVWLAWAIEAVRATSRTSLLGHVLGLGGGVVVNSLLFAVAGMTISLLLRQWGLLAGMRRHAIGIALINTLILVPIRAAGFARMNADRPWGTRSGGFRGTATPLRWQLVPAALAIMLLTAFTAAGISLR